MAGMILSLNHKSAMALREFAEAIPQAIQNISDDTDKLIGVYQSVQEKVGVHGDDFHNLLQSIEKVQKDAAQAMEALPHMLIETAVKIETYVSNNPMA